MSANALIVCLLIVLALTAAALRLATGPILALKDGDTLYSMAKSGPFPAPPVAGVELAAGDGRPAR